MARLLLIASLMLLLRNPAYAEAEPLTTEADIPAALEAFEKWTAAFLSGDYQVQRAMTDPRIVRWYDKSRWKRLMHKAKRNGTIVSIQVDKAVSIASENIPCTEQGHCYRKDVPVLMFLLKTEYTKNTPPQPEYAVMARSDKGWLFGGGTFPNRPMGETLLIMNKKDFKKYRFDASRDLPR